MLVIALTEHSCIQVFWSIVRHEGTNDEQVDQVVRYANGLVIELFNLCKLVGSKSAWLPKYRAVLHGTSMMSPYA